MGIFNYNRFHYFDKDGNELILKKESPVTFQLKNTNDPTSQSEYVFVRSLPDQNDSSINQIAANGVFDKTTDGHRYSIELSGDGKQTNSLVATINNENRVIPAADFAKPVSYTSNLGVQYSPVLGDTSALKAHILDSLEVDSIPFPSCTFESKITFPKVSTELVETQSICVLIENEYAKDNISVNKFTTVRDYAEDASTAGNQDPYSYINRFKLFFFIDNREQSDFRLFTTNGSNVIWSDRLVLDLTNESVDYVFENGFRIDVGFCGKQEGVYEQDMYVCLLDTENDNMVYPIGTIHMSAEAVGEDERYRTFFTNFGIPDPKEYNDVFRETPNIEDGIDYISINKHSKQMFLAYSEIFPYIGTYKALINAIKTLGYEDILFKEWYKELGDNTYDDGGYISYEINFDDPTANKISNTPLEERIHLKKMNWITMFYKINEELDIPVDQWGFPTVVLKSNYYTTNNIVKVISLKRWLEKYITGVNCRITGISGEGVVFERYSLPKYGGYQQVFDYRNSKPVYPIVLDDAVSLKDSSAYINIEISTTTGGVTFEEAEHQSFQDYCEGYFNSTKTFCNGNNVTDNSTFIYYGKTFEQNETYGQLDLVSKCETKHYRLSDGIIDASTASLIIDNDRILLDPHDLLTKPRTARFTKLPIIQIKKGYLKTYAEYRDNTGHFNYFAEIKPNNSSSLIATIYTGTKSSIVFDKQEYVTLTPPTYTEDTTDIYITPVSRNFGTNKAARIRKSKYNDNLYRSKTCIGNTSQTNDVAKADASIGDVTPGDFNMYSFGLVYDTNNVNGIPAFRVTGYESEYVAFSSNNHFPYMPTGNNDASVSSLTDYFLEILEGRMIFYSAENDEDVVINFSQYESGNQKIDIEIYKRHHCSLQYTYRKNTEEYIHKFLPGKIYRSFFDNYNVNNLDAIILYDNLTKMKVYNEGKYTISAILQDEHNNIFTAKSSTQPLVVTPNIDVLGLGGNVGTNTTISAAEKNDANVCIFEYVPKLLVDNVNVDRMTIDVFGKATYIPSNTDRFIEHNTGTLTLNTYDDDYKFVTVSNMIDRCEVGTEIDSSQFDTSVYHMFRRAITPESTMPTNIYSEYLTETKNISVKESGSDSNDLVQLLKNIVSTRHNYIEGSNADVYLTIFDNVCDKPVAAMAATMCGNRESHYWSEHQGLLVLYDDPQTIWGVPATTYFNNSRYSVYTTPAWALEMKDRKNSDSSLSTQFVERNGKGYVFTSHYQDHVGNKLYKISYGSPDNKYFGSFTSYADLRSSIVPGMEISAINTTKMVDASLWISPMCSEYTSYKLSGKSFDTSTFKLTLDDTDANKNILKFIDDRFSVSRRNFDIDNAIDSWNIPVSLNTIKNKGEKFEVNSSNDVVFKIDSTQATKYQIETRKWSIYRKVDNSDRELYFECFNNVLFMKNLKQGVYDIELTAYDKHGNKYFKRLDGYLTVK
jgi:hypothetical protein